MSIAKGDRLIIAALGALCTVTEVRPEQTGLVVCLEGEDGTPYERPPEALTTEDGAQVEHDAPPPPMAPGSQVKPSTIHQLEFDINGEHVLLSDLTLRAYHRSNMGLNQWNSLSDEARNAIITDRIRYETEVEDWRGQDAAAEAEANRAAGVA